MNDGGFFGELRDFSCDAIIKADAEGKKQIAIVNRIVGIDGAVHTEPFEGLGIIFWKAAYAHESRCDRDAGRTGKLEEIGFRSGSDDAPADIKDGTLGFFDEAENFMEGDLVWRGRAVVAGNIHLGGPRHLSGGLLNVFRNIDNDGAGSARGSDMKSFRHDAGNISRMHHEIAVFDDGEGNAKNIGFLECTPADGGRGDLTGDGNHRDGVHVRIGDTGNEIGGTWAGSGHHDADFSGRAGIAFGHKGSALFVAGKNGADLFGAGEGLVEHHARTAGIGEDGVDTSVLESLDE